MVDYLPSKFWAIMSQFNDQVKLSLLISSKLSHMFFSVLVLSNMQLESDSRITLMTVVLIKFVLLAHLVIFAATSSSLSYDKPLKRLPIVL